MARQDYYDVLGVGRNASSDEIKRAFRAKAKTLHPDINKAEDAEEQFKELNEAYAVLSDDQKRAAYDRFGHAGVSGNAGGYGTADFSDIGDIFEQFMGFGGARTRSANAPRRGADLHVKLNIDFEESVKGTQREIEIERKEICSHCNGSGAEPGSQVSTCGTCNGRGEVRQVRQTFLGQMVSVVTCPTCGGRGQTISTPCSVCAASGFERRQRRLKVNIPAGVDTGQQIRLTGEGNIGTNGGPPGNLYVVIEVEPHKFFKRHNYDILLEMDINFTQAALGTRIEVPTIDGVDHIDVPAGTQPGAVFRLRGQGIPFLKRNGRGDQIVVANVTIPRRLNSKQRQLLSELADTFGDDTPQPSAGKQGFFDNLRDFLGMD